MSIVFLSYAHEDHELKDEVEGWLKVLKFNGVQLEIWSDTRLAAGDSWKQVIESTMARAEIALVIVTRHFLASEFIRVHELPYLDERARSGELRLIALMAEPAPIASNTVFQRLQRVPTGTEPLSGLSSHERNSVMTGLVTEIQSLLEATPSPDPQTAPPPPLVPSEQTESGVTVELVFRHYEQHRYDVELRQRDSGSSSRRRVRFRAEIGPNLLDPPVDMPPLEYASRLWRAIIPPGAAEGTLESVFPSGSPGICVLRISVEPTARDLNRIRWEMLETLTDRRLEVLRYASPGGETWRKPTTRSSPPPAIGLASLGGVDAAEQFASYAQRLAPIAPLREPVAIGRLEEIGPMKTPVTLLAVHAALDGDRAYLRVQGEQGEPSRCDGEEAMNTLLGLRHAPQILILQSVTDPDEPSGDGRIERALVMLAADLVKAGLCAVVTTQSPMPEHAWQSFLIGLLETLHESGNLDEATRRGRDVVGDPEQAWKPIVLSRLRTGRVWFRAAFMGNDDDAWEMLLERAVRGTVIPILGPNLGEYLTHPRPDLAMLLADKFDYPMAHFERDNLPKVSQYIATMMERQTVLNQVLDTAQQYITKKLGPDGDPTDDSIDQQLRRAWEDDLSRNPNDPYRVLAELKAKIYVTTSYNPFLSLAIRTVANEQGREDHHPRDRIWTIGKGILNADEDGDDSRFSLSRTQPLTYYLFGRFDQARDLVLTEDDHFRFLLNFKEHWRSLPNQVRSAFSDSAFLFLGFRLEDWDFRALFRAFLELEGSEEMKTIPHVAVQVDPDDDRLTDPTRTRDYLIEYFKQFSDKPRIYLGSASDFLAEIKTRQSQP